MTNLSLTQYQSTKDNSTLQCLFNYTVQYKSILSTILCPSQFQLELLKLLEPVEPKLCNEKEQTYNTNKTKR